MPQRQADHNLGRILTAANQLTLTTLKWPGPVFPLLSQSACCQRLHHAGTAQSSGMILPLRDHAVGLAVSVRSPMSSDTSRDHSRNAGQFHRPEHCCSLETHGPPLANTDRAPSPPSFLFTTSQKWNILRRAQRASELPPVCCVHNSLLLSPAAPSPSGHSDRGSLAGAQRAAKFITWRTWKISDFY